MEPEIHYTIRTQLRDVMKILIKKLHPNAREPVYGSAGAAAFDLHAATVNASDTAGARVIDIAICGTGLAFEIPPGHGMLILSRSGHGFKNDVRLANCVGLIDSDYRGEVHVKLTRDRDGDDGGVDPLLVKPGDRIAQAIIIPIAAIKFDVVDELSTTARGAGGLGSTGS